MEKKRFRRDKINEFRGGVGKIIVNDKRIIVTHIFPDLDAITSVWLLKRFDQDWEKAECEFVPAGETYMEQVVDSDPMVVHVDTGLGRFDHHQTNERTCASELVFNYLKHDKKLSLNDQSGLKRLIEIVIQIDHFEDFFWDDSSNDRYDFCLHNLFDYLKLSGKLDDKKLIDKGMLLLDSVLFGLKQKIRTESEFEKGEEFETVWGRSLALETKISNVSKLGQKKGYDLIVFKEPQTNFVSIKCQPRPELDLIKAYEALKQKDSKADWFFHQSRHIILNGSRHNPKVRPSSLDLSQIVSLLKNIS